MSPTGTLPPDIAAVRALQERRVWLEYTDGTAAEIDLAPLLTGALHAAVRADDALFAQVAVDGAGTIAWPDGTDLAPEPLYAAARSQTARPS